MNTCNVILWCVRLNEHMQCDIAAHDKGARKLRAVQAGGRGSAQAGERRGDAGREGLGVGGAAGGIAALGERRLGVGGGAGVAARRRPSKP